MTTQASDAGAALDEAGRPYDQIRLVGISATGYHGVFDHERRDGQVFRADVVVHLDTRRAAASDDLTLTVDYGTLGTQIAAVLAGEPVDLVETLAERIAATALAHPAVEAVDVVVHKPQAPLTVPFEDIVVAIRRDRHKLPAAQGWTPTDQAWTPPDDVRTPPAVVWTPTSGDPVPRELAEPVEPAQPATPATVPDDDYESAAFGFAAVAAAVAAAAPARPDGAAPTADVEPADEPMRAESAPDREEAPEPEQVERDRLEVAPDHGVQVVLSLGSNQGAAKDTLREAVGELAALDGLDVDAVSPLARTTPVGGPEQPDFLNAVVIASTTLSPMALLRATQHIESAHGRERHERWGPRTLDIDLIVYGSTLTVTDDLELPHPRAHERAFVLQPWVEIAPDAVLPGLGGGPVAALAATAPDRGGIRWLALDWLDAPHAAPEPDAPTPRTPSHVAEPLTGEVPPVVPDPPTGEVPVVDVAPPGWHLAGPPAPPTAAPPVAGDRFP